ncbi:MAG TPA: hypothetical protein VK852_10670, partial [Desulfobacterales bacterium]|nr:hypothetical protein [Desulfobacterales bacterium]
ASQQPAKKALWLFERSEFHRARRLREAQGSPKAPGRGRFLLTVPQKSQFPRCAASRSRCGVQVYASLLEICAP